MDNLVIRKYDDIDFREVISLLKSQFNISDSIEYLNGELRIVLYSEEILDLDKIVEATNIINPILDKHDFIKESYVLDVSSKEKGGEK